MKNVRNYISYNINKHKKGIGQYKFRLTVSQKRKWHTTKIEFTKKRGYWTLDRATNVTLKIILGWQKSGIFNFNLKDPIKIKITKL